jgi:hypothetical protein
MPGKFFKIKLFFFTSWGSFPYKKEKKSFYEKFAGRQQYLLPAIKFRLTCTVKHVEEIRTAR